MAGPTVGAGRPATVTIGAITPTPSDDEVAAIVAAIEATWPRPTVLDRPSARISPWRWSGRWWARPPAARRDRPFL